MQTSGMQRVHCHYTAAILTLYTVLKRNITAIFSFRYSKGLYFSSEVIVISIINLGDSFQPIHLVIFL